MAVTKEQAREIYNHYSQIESTSKAIETLRKVAEESKNSNALKDGIIPDKYTFGGSIKMEIPSWMLERHNSSFSSCSIYNISVNDAILVLENHIKRLSEQLEVLQKECGGEHADADKDDIQKRVFDVITNCMPQDDGSDIQLTDDLQKDLGFDSFDEVELVIGLEKDFGVKITEEAWENVHTVYDAVQVVKDILGEQ